MFTIAVAGLGNRISGVIGNLNRAAPGRLRLAGWVDPSPKGLENLRKEGLDAGAGCDDLAALIAREKPDAVMIGTPNHLHVKYIRIALEAGCRVFSEKPVAVDRAQSLELARLMAKHGPDRLQVGLVLRSSPLFGTVRTALKERLGTLISFEANEHLNPEHGAFVMRDWRRYRAYAGCATAPGPRAGRASMRSSPRMPMSSTTRPRWSSTPTACNWRSTPTPTVPASAAGACAAPAGRSKATSRPGR